MKTVTVETVRERLSYLEGLNARGVGTAVPQQQFELACLRELLARMQSRTVTVKLPAEYLNADGSVNADMANTCPVVSAYREAHHAAGIQVIEGEG
jgi:hypothetical protein